MPIWRDLDQSRNSGATNCSVNSDTVTRKQCVEKWFRSEFGANLPLHEMLRPECMTQPLQAMAPSPILPFLMRSQSEEVKSGL